MELAIDTVVGGRYRVEERLGSGAMGIVYRVRHTKLNRAFAIKALHPALVANEKLRRRFQREADIASSLRHRNVVGVVDVGEFDNLAFIVMELADGVPLSHLMTEPLPKDAVIDCMRQLCDGLQHAHEAGLIHRDFKPDNVIVERDRSGEMTLRIIDFGIAMLRDEASQEDRERLTTEGIVLGTPHYMAPEHASGEHVDQRIDLFALGVILFEMLTGKMPFDGDGVDVARANIMYDPPSMSVRAPEVDVDPLLEALTRKLMARRRDQRFSTAKEVRELIDQIANDRSAAAIALGVAKPTLVGAAPIPPAVVALSRGMVAQPPVMPAPRRAPSTIEPSMLVSTLTTDAPPTDQIEPVRRRRRRISIIGAGLATLGLGLVLAVAMTSGGDKAAASQIGDTAPHSESIVIKATPAREELPAPPPPARPIPDEVVEPASIVPAPVPATIPKPPIAQQVAKPVKPATPNPTEIPADGPTATQVADLYGVVGRALGQLQQTKGSDATIDLWPRFRHIRINDGIATVSSRRETLTLLQQLQRDVDTRRTR